MKASMKRPWRLLAVPVSIVALMATSFSAVGSAAEEESGKNLSVPAVYIGSGGPALHSPCGAAVTPTGETSTFPEDFALPLAGVTPGEYYVQGEDTWQASCMVGSSGLAVDAAWGDNLTGAPLKTGTPIRIEIGLLPSDMTPYTEMTGYDVVKLTDELDRLATYGTLGNAVTPYPEVRVWAEDATYSVQNTETGAYVVPPDTPFSAEINSTGRIVFGAQLQVTQAGTYVIAFDSPNVVFSDGGTSTSITITVASSAGGGKGSGGNGGGGGPDNPGGGKGGGNGGGGPRGPK